MAGVSATDAEDGDLTGDIVVSGEVNTNKVGAYPLTYSMTDSDSNTTEEIRQVTVYNTAPVINGINNETILVNSDFDPMEGVSATDAEDGDISSSAIQVSGQVNTLRLLGNTPSLIRSPMRREKRQPMIASSLSLMKKQAVGHGIQKRFIILEIKCYTMA